jgi:hypothetical protein
MTANHEESAICKILIGGKRGDKESNNKTAKEPAGCRRYKGKGNGKMLT